MILKFGQNVKKIVSDKDHCTFIPKTNFSTIQPRILSGKSKKNYKPSLSAMTFNMSLASQRNDKINKQEKLQIHQAL